MHKEKARKRAKNRYCCRQRYFSAFMIMLLLLIQMKLPCMAEEKQQKVLRVAFPQTEGYTMTSEDGKRYGLVVDVLNEVAKYTGWKYEYVDVESDKIIERFEAGDFDLMGGQYYIEGFEKNCGYPKYNCGYSKLILLARRNDETIKGFDLSTFNGKTIGVYDQARENIRRLEIYLELNKLDCTLKYYTTNDMQETGNLNRYLQDGDVDLLLGNSAAAEEDDFCIVATFDSQPHYIVTQPEDQETLDALNRALENILDADPDFTRKVYENNFPNSSHTNIRLSQKERAYIQEKKTVTVAVPNDWHPLYCLDNSDEHNGFIPDILDRVSEYTGLEFEYIHFSNYKETIEAVQNGNADMAGFYLGSDDEALNQGLALTYPYVDLNFILVRNKESTYPSEGLTGGIIDGKEMPENIAVETVVQYGDVADALEDVNTGKLDFVYGISARIESIIQQQYYTNLMQVNLVNDSQGIRFALTSPARPELLAILNKSINSLTVEDHTMINSRNLVSIGETHMSLSSIVYAYPDAAIAFVVVFLTLILAVVVIMARAKLHAGAMRNELERAEAGNRAKSEFLSRMSHEIRTPMNAIVGLTDLTVMTEGLSDKAKENLCKIKLSSRYLLNLINDILDMSSIENGKMEISSEPFSMNAMLDDIENMLQQDVINRKLNFVMERNFADDVVMGDTIRLRQVILNLLSNAFKFTPEGGAVITIITEENVTEENATFTFCVRDTGIGIAEEDQQRIFYSFEQLGSNLSKSQGTGLGLAISNNIVHMMGGDLKLKSEQGEGSEFYFTVTFPKGHLEDKAEEKSAVEQDFLSGKLILIAEDNELNAEIVTTLLQTQGAKVLRAKNGKMALEQFRQSVPGAVDAILMDIQMPDMNGLEATSAIRALNRFDAKSIPIIAMTANAFKEDEMSAITAGMTGFVSKPIDVSCLYDSLQSALAENRDVSKSE